MREYYKDGCYWRHDSHPQVVRLFGGESGAKGDIISNTCRKIVHDNDTSDWAHDALYACADDLLDGRRWPRRMDQAIDAKNRFDAGWRKVLVFISHTSPWQENKPRCKLMKNFPSTWKYRWVTGMTRDPFTAFYTACTHLGEWDLIAEVQPMWYNYRPSFWAWRKYLMTGDIKYLKRYRWWSKFSKSKKDYVVRLRELREIAIKNKES